MMAFSAYSLAYGIRYTHSLFRFANLLTFWLAILYYKESISKRQYKGNFSTSKEDEEVEREVLVGPTDVHMMIPQSVESRTILPERLSASLKTRQEGYTIKENGKSEFGFVTNGSLSHKDALLEEYLDTLDEYFACKKRISEKITGGHFQLSKARMQLGRLTSLNQSWDARMKASLIVKVGSEGRLQLKRVKKPNNEDEGDLIPEKLESSTLRKRRVATEDFITKEANFKASSQEVEGDERKKKMFKQEKKVQAFDPLYQFAALPPPSLRKAQSEFFSALENITGSHEHTGLLQLQRQLKRLEEMILSIT